MSGAKKPQVGSSPTFSLKGKPEPATTAEPGAQVETAIAEAAAPEIVIRKPLVLTPIPNTANRGTYTGALQLGDVVIAVDDFTDEELAELAARERGLTNARDEAEEKTRVYRAELAKCKDPERSEELLALITQCNTTYDAAQNQILELFREVCGQHVKGVREEDGSYYPFEVSPIRTAPARRSVTIWLTRRATLGASEADFLAVP